MADCLHRSRMAPRVLGALLLLSPLLLPAAAPARAAALASTPKATLQHLNGEVDKLLRKPVAAGSPAEDAVKKDIKKLAAELLDYGELAKRALADNWETLKPKERTEFVATLKELIERNYVKQLRTNLNYQVIYGDEKLDGEEAQVQSTVKIRTQGKATDAVIEYRMLKTGGRWMVYDVVTDELSLVRNYRSQFQKIIGQQGYAGLLAKMKKKLAEDKG